jgi:hypothetical protein
MTRRYVVAVEEMTKPQEEEFLAYIRSERMGWWHWISNFWLLIDRHDAVTASAIRDKLREISEPSRCLVMQVDHITWSGMRNDPKMFEWIKSTWKED